MTVTLSDFVFAVRPGVSNDNLVTGQSATIRYNFTGSECALGGYMALPRPAAVGPSLGTNYTIVVVMDPNNAVSGYRGLISVPPYTGASHVAPYADLSLVTNGASSAAILVHSINSTTNVVVSSGLEFLQTDIDGQTCYAARRNGNSVEFVKNGVLHSVASGAGLVAPQNNAPTADITIGGRSSTAPGEGCVGSYLFVGIANRWLTDEELLDITNNPLTFGAPINPNWIGNDAFISVVADRFLRTENINTFVTDENGNKIGEHWDFQVEDINVTWTGTPAYIDVTPTSSSFTGSGTLGDLDFVYAVRPTVSNNEIITGASPTAVSNFTSGVASSATNSYLAHAKTPGVLALTTQWTIVVVVDPADSGTGWNALLSIPAYASGTHVDPYHALGLMKVANTTVLQHYFTDTNIGRTALSPSGVINPSTDTQTCYAARRNGTSVEFLRNGVVVGTATTTAGSVDFTPSGDITIANRAVTSPSEGMAGTFYFAGIANRLLSNQELLDITANPLSFEGQASTVSPSSRLTSFSIPTALIKSTARALPSRLDTSISMQAIQPKGQLTVTAAVSEETGQVIQPGWSGTAKALAVHRLGTSTRPTPILRSSGRTQPSVSLRTNSIYTPSLRRSSASTPNFVSTYFDIFSGSFGTDRSVLFNVLTSVSNVTDPVLRISAIRPNSPILTASSFYDPNPFSSGRALVDFHSALVDIVSPALLGNSQVTGLCLGTSSIVQPILKSSARILGTTGLFPATVQTPAFRKTASATGSYSTSITLPTPNTKGANRLQAGATSASFSIPSSNLFASGNVTATHIAQIDLPLPFVYSDKNLVANVLARPSTIYTPSFRRTSRALITAYTSSFNAFIPQFGLGRNIPASLFDAIGSISNAQFSAAAQSEQTVLEGTSVYSEPTPTANGKIPATFLGTSFNIHIPLYKISSRIVGLSNVGSTWNIYTPSTKKTAALSYSSFSIASTIGNNNISASGRSSNSTILSSSAVPAITAFSAGRVNPSALVRPLAVSTPIQSATSSLDFSPYSSNFEVFSPLFQYSAAQTPVTFTSGFELPFATANIQLPLEASTFVGENTVYIPSASGSTSKAVSTVFGNISHFSIVTIDSATYHTILPVTTTTAVVIPKPFIAKALRITGDLTPFSAVKIQSRPTVISGAPITDGKRRFSLSGWKKVL